MNIAKMVSFPTDTTEILLSGPAGQLQVLVELPRLSINEQAIGVICHPHPLYGGTMHNKVVHTVARAWQHRGYATLRFNFRGVEKSEGCYGEGVAEQEDLLCVLNWIQQHKPQAEIFLAGFSFGSFVSAAVAQHFKVKQLVLVAPPVHHFPFSLLKRFTTRAVVVQGEQDELVPFNQVSAWCASRDDVKLIKLPEATHFFHGQLIKLRQLIEAENGHGSPTAS